MDKNKMKVQRYLDQTFQKRKWKHEMCANGSIIISFIYLK